MRSSAASIRGDSNVRTGAATGYPATVALKTFSVRVVDDEVWVDV
jgi:nitrite reductase/ring-hydroxylating ferredoxin subunit